VIIFTPCVMKKANEKRTRNCSSSAVSYSLRATLMLTILLISLSSMGQNITGKTSVCVNSSTALSCTIPGGVWSSGDNSIASVDRLTGTVTGISAGTSIITYNSPDATVTVPVTVDRLPDPGTITGPNAVCIGHTISLASVGGDAGGTWTAKNTIVIVVKLDQLGNVTGNAKGSDSVIYTVSNSCGTRTASANVSVCKSSA
jgi:hypothetical protein